MGHEVINITLDDGDTLSSSSEYSPSKPSLDINQSSDATRNLGKTRRGWDGFDTVTIIEGHGIGNKKALGIFVLLMLGVFLTPIDPEARNFLYRNETANFYLKIVTGIIALATSYIMLFGKPKIIITPSGFYWCFLWRKVLVTWAGCSEFSVRRDIVTKGIVMDDEVKETIVFSHKTLKEYFPLSLSNVSPTSLCKSMNKYRERYLDVDDS